MILPGVGAFADAMEKIRHYGLEETIHEVVEKNIPFLGICLGLQLMFESSDEGPGVKRTWIITWKDLKNSKEWRFKDPHMGWNNIKVKIRFKIIQRTARESLCIFCTFLLSSGRR